ncbi:hypothetical protein ACHAWO_011895 [Cyclotella atomus]|uniref:Uncharacterized protein n=1 Tax=Cyclotella atomus TaxID=382360 RepID=A0ABD3NXF8_9STRA
MRSVICSVAPLRWERSSALVVTRLWGPGFGG